MLLAVDIPPSVYRSLTEQAGRDGMNLRDWLVKLLSTQAGGITPPTTEIGALLADGWPDEPMTEEDARIVEETVAYMDECDLLLREDIEPIN